jgi:pimeloyl-ACP methyl ester carboxylesterase
MSGLERRVVDVGGRETVVYEGGEGRPLVFLHGGGIVEGVDCFVPLTEGFRFLAPQMPGFGGTALEPALGGIDDLVEHNARLLDALGVEQIVLVGHSLGGWAAASFAAAHPRRVSRLVIAAAYGLDTPEHPIANARAMAPGELYRALSSDPAVWEGRLPDGPDPVFEEARAREARSLGGLVGGPFDPSLEAKLATLRMPLLIQWGDDDQIVPFAHLEAWRRALPDAGIDVYGGAGHLLYWERPDAVAAVAAFAAG